MSNPFPKCSLDGFGARDSPRRATRHPVIARLAAHPASSLAGREFVAQLPAHFLYRLATRVSVQRWEVVFHCHPSQAHAQQWHVVGIDITLQQRRAVLCGGALLSVLVPRLLCVQGESGVRLAVPSRAAHRVAAPFPGVEQG